VVTRLGCPCGCTPDDDCISGRPLPDVRNRCSSCGVLGFGEIRAARALGWHCAAGCVAERLGIIDSGIPA
jgi:hypothetical protein